MERYQTGKLVEAADIAVPINAKRVTAMYRWRAGSAAPTITFYTIILDANSIVLGLAQIATMTLDSSDTTNFSYKAVDLSITPIRPRYAVVMKVTGGSAFDCDIEVQFTD